MYTRHPFDDLFDVFRDFDSLFRRTYGDAATVAPGRTRLLAPSTKPGSTLEPYTQGRWSELTYLPAVESFSKDGKLVIRAELPGVDPADVNVSITGNRLQISGEKKFSREVSESEVYFREIAEGRFDRAFTLPEGVKADQLKARFENGVLELTVPAPEETKSRKIQIEVAGAKQVKAA